MHKLKMAAAFAAFLAASPAQAQDITVWDFNGGDPALASYFAKAKAEFEAAHRGAKLNVLGQPHDQYYTLLGTALASNSGPDIFVVNGGAQAKARIDAMVKLDDKAPDLIKKLVGQEAFQGPDGSLYAFPVTLQGHAIYYNKKLYKDAGLDPEKAPTTWAELQKVCDAFKAKGKVPCFVMGNREGAGAEFFFSQAAAQSLTAKEQDDWLAGKLKWSSPQIKAILQSWVDTGKAGWYQQGANSTLKFMDEYEMFMRGEGGNTMGLLSNVAHWKQFETEMGVENVGVYPSPSPSIAADKKQGEPGVPVAGGVAYAVNKASKHLDLALAAAEALAASGPIQTFVNDAGIVPANTTVDLAGLTSPGIKRIMGWLATNGVATAHANSSAAELEEWHRQSQLLLNGETTVDAAAAALDAVQAKAKPQKS